ncbi:hypothetical protein QN277_019898 [Acacia crassicarpa]|uniref:Uncharacterized protein n=1 Tax=Acacia crassicarpa TaxID=499986 RepID=A0AAE1MNU0_9FABA|nr:hypothetical protein QN277_019898 [Acacia crassicarpa]
MIGGIDLPNGLDSDGENSRSKLSKPNFDRGRENLEEKLGYPAKGVYFLKNSEDVDDGILLKRSKVGPSCVQELTLSYLCGKEIPSKSLLSSLERVGGKGKEVIILEDSNQGGKWVEQDFLNLSETRENSSKQSDEDVEREMKDKKLKQV